MWKVTNEENKRVLKIFHKKLVIPFFKELISYKILLDRKTIKSIDIYSYYNSSEIKKDKSKEIFRKIINLKKNKKKISDYLDNFIQNNNIENIRKYYKVYLIQYNKLNNLDFSILYVKIDKNLKIIFSDFFYEKFFILKTVWDLLIDRKYNREVFHLNFKKENNLEVCPYCDADTIINIGNQEIEHFLPRSKYPFLSMHPYNLISSCHSCNKSYGKASNYFTPIISPFNEQIGDKINFNVDNNNKSVLLVHRDEIKLKNYIKLLKLKEKYEKENVYKFINEKGHRYYGYYYKKNSNGDFDKKIFLEYLDFNKKEPYYFASKSIFNKLEKYNNYLKTIEKS